MMPRKATIYVYSVTVVGMAVLLGALYRWQSPDLPRFLAYLGLASLGGMLKVRLPGREGTYSLSFLFALLSVLDLKFPEAIVIGAVGAFVQSVWRTAKRPKFVQVLFNGANFSISIAVCCLVGQRDRRDGAASEPGGGAFDHGLSVLCREHVPGVGDNFNA